MKKEITFKEYFEALQRIYETHPDAKLVFEDVEIGQETLYLPVNYLPSAGFLDDTNGFTIGSEEINVVCL